MQRDSSKREKRKESARINVLRFKLKLCSTLKAVNHYLLEEHVPRHNRKLFPVVTDRGSAYQPVPRA